MSICIDLISVSFVLNYAKTFAIRQLLQQNNGSDTTISISFDKVKGVRRYKQVSA